MEIIISPNPEIASRRAAEVIKEQLLRKRASVLGLATGGTVVGLYGELIKMYKAGEISFKKVSSFNLDEYVGLSPDDPNSYHTFMAENFFSKSTSTARTPISRTAAPKISAPIARSTKTRYANSAESTCSCWESVRTGTSALTNPVLQSVRARA